MSGKTQNTCLGSKPVKHPCVPETEEKCKELNRTEAAASLGSNPEVDSGSWEFRE